MIEVSSGAALHALHTLGMGDTKISFFPLTITSKWNPMHNLFHFVWVDCSIPFLKIYLHQKSDQPLKSYHSSWRRVQDWQFKLSEMLKQWAFPLIHIPIYSLNFDLPLLLGHVILFGRLRLGLGITSKIEDFIVIRSCSVMLYSSGDCAWVLGSPPGLRIFSSINAPNP
jgi:hypothetical protein